MATLKVKFNKDNTITIKCGKHVENISVEFKTREELFECIKWVSISKGANLSDIQITELMRNIDFREE